MSLYDGPRDVSAKLTELERSLDVPGYDHQKGAMTGWRAEHKFAQMRAGDLKKRKPAIGTKALTDFFAKLSALLRSTLQAR